MAAPDSTPDDPGLHLHLHGWPADPSPELRRALADAIAELASQSPPRDAMERHLVEQVALHRVRLRRLQQTEAALRDHRERLALQRWESHRAAEAEALMERLADPTATDAERTTVLHALRSEASGCEALLAAWSLLVTALDERNRLSGAEGRQILRLLGQSTPPGPACPAEVAELWWLALLTQVSAPTTARGRYELCEIRDHLARQLNEQLEELTRRRDQLWSAESEPERAELAALARAQMPPDAARLARVIAATDRLHQRALEALERYRLRRG